LIPSVFKLQIHNSTYAESWVWDTCPNGRLRGKPISANSNSNLHPNPKTQKYFPENEMTSFFEQVSRATL